MTNSDTSRPWGVEDRRESKGTLREGIRMERERIVELAISLAGWGAILALTLPWADWPWVAGAVMIALFAWEMTHIVRHVLRWRRLRQLLAFHVHSDAAARRGTASAPPGRDFWEEAPDGRRNVLVPDLGDGSRSAEIVRWIARRGDPIEPLQPLAEVMYDAATVEVHAPVDGVLDEIPTKAGDDVKIGSVLCRLRP
ncbi:MAG: lipoyl domain-containing protein [Planctomycetota bacterium]